MNIPLHLLAFCAYNAIVALRKKTVQDIIHNCAIAISRSRNKHLLMDHRRQIINTPKYYSLFNKSFQTHYTEINTMTQNTIIFIDFANFNCAFNIIRKEQNIPAHHKIDYNKLIDMIALGRNIVGKNLYIESKNGDTAHSGFLYFFKSSGFTVITKEKKVINIGHGETKNKANFDVEITFDACTHIWKRECDEIILISGDSDFLYLIEEAKKLHVHTTVISSCATLSQELRDSAAHVILLDNIDKDQYLLKKNIPETV